MLDFTTQVQVVRVQKTKHYVGVAALRAATPNDSILPGFQYSPNTSPLGNGISVPHVEVPPMQPQQPRVVVNGWTVDEQIYKSKLWLKQRNQQMLHRK